MSYFRDIGSMSAYDDDSEKETKGDDCFKKKSRNGDTLGPVELNVGLEQGNQ